MFLHKPLVNLPKCITLESSKFNIEFVLKVNCRSDNQ